MMKIFSLLSLFLSIANANPTRDMRKYREICRKEEGVNSRLYDKLKEQCIYRCILDKIGIISKDGKFSAALYPDSEKEHARKCFELKKDLPPCNRAYEYLVCMHTKSSEEKCAKAIGYSLNNPDDPRRKCAERCILMDRDVLTPRGELNGAKLNPASQLIDHVCFEKFRSEDTCTHISKYNACVTLSSFEIFCQQKLAKTPNADCISACALENLGDLSDKYELKLANIPISYRSEAASCYESAMGFKKCKLADEYRKCVYRETIHKDERKILPIYFNQWFANRH